MFLTQRAYIRIQQECAGTLYNVVQGDTLNAIAIAHDVSLEKLVAANPGVDPNNLIPGTLICIPRTPAGTPPGEAPTAPGQVECPDGIPFTVTNETLLDILKYFPQMSLAAIGCQNTHVNLDLLAPGMQLCIPRNDYFKICAGDEVYIVRTGDTADTIARRLNVPIERMLVANPTLRFSDYGIRGIQVCVPRRMPGAISIRNQNPDQATNSNSQTPSFYQSAQNQDPYQDCLNHQLVTIQNQKFADLLEQYDFQAGAFVCLNRNIDFSKPLQPGMKLCIPAGERYKPCLLEDYYSIRRGDNLEVIARKLGVDPIRLIQKNALFSYDDYSVMGKRVCIPPMTPNENR